MQYLSKSDSMKQINILIVEDDFLNRRLIRKVLVENNYQVFEAKNLKESMENLERSIPDMAILDINLGDTEQNGIYIGHLIKEKYAIPFIYLTAYDTPDIIKKAINTTPTSYITKPFKNVDLLASVEIALQQISGKEKPKPFIVVKDSDYNVKLPINDIDYIESEGNYLMIHKDQNVYKIRSTIKQVMEEIPQLDFVQTHRAFVVNKKKIKKFSHKELVVNGDIIPISKSFLTQLKQDLFKTNGIE